MTAAPRHNAAWTATLILCALLSGLCAWLSPARFFPAYLAAVLFWTSIPVGSALLLCVHWLAPGRWGSSIRHEAEAAASTCPLVLLLVPVIGAPRFLFQASHEEVSTQAQRFLAFPFWSFRCASYVVLWLVIGLLIARWSRAIPPGALPPRKLQVLAATALVLLSFSTGFAATDLIAALQPGWTSSVLGLYVLVSSALTALAMILAIALRRSRPHEPSANQDLATMLLTLSVLYIYIAFSQFFITWNGNLPSDVRWYHPRASGGWSAVAIAIVVSSFVLPLLALLLTTVKRTAPLLAGVAIIVIGGRLLDAGWLVLPVFNPLVSWTSALMYALIGAIGVLWYRLYTSASQRAHT